MENNTVFGVTLAALLATMLGLAWLMAGDRGHRTPELNPTQALPTPDANAVALVGTLGGRQVHALHDADRRATCYILTGTNVATVMDCLPDALLYDGCTTDADCEGTP